MSFQARVGMTIAATVAVAVVVAAVAAYLLTSRALTAEVDRALSAIGQDVLTQVERAPDLPPPGLLGPRAGRLGGAGGFVQVIDADGNTLGAAGLELPVTDGAREVAAGLGGAFHETVIADGQAVRVFTTPAPRDLALQVARPLDEVEATVQRLQRRLVAVALLGIAGAAGAGWLLAGRAVRPVRRLTDTAAEVARTQDLTHRITIERDDELGRLAASFNEMLTALERARQQQRQLVADASHELRTPLTSLRTNIEVLASGADLTPEDRRALLGDLVGELEEFGRIVDDLVELARGEAPLGEPAPVRLDELAEEVAARFERRVGSPLIEVDAEPCTVSGDRDRLTRAIRNLVDNAVKYAGEHGPISVSVQEHRDEGGLRFAEVRVADRGPGIAASDRPHVFDRFYRAVEARGEPGSGLGLAIVAQVAQAHGGTAELRSRPGGGTEVVLRVPLHPASADS